MLIFGLIPKVSVHLLVVSLLRNPIVRLRRITLYINVGSNLKHVLIT